MTTNDQEPSTDGMKIRAAIDRWALGGVASSGKKPP